MNGVIDETEEINFSYTEESFTLDFHGAYEPDWLQLDREQATKLRNELNNFLAQFK